MPTRDTTLVTLAEAKRYLRLATVVVLAAPSPAVGGATVLGDVSGWKVGSLLTVDITTGQTITTEQVNITSITGQALAWSPNLSTPPLAGDVISDGGFDSGLVTFLDSTSEFMEDYTGRVFKARSVSDQFTGNGRRSWWTKYYPIQDVVVQLAGVTVDSSTYVVDPLTGQIKMKVGNVFGTTDTGDSVVAYTAGYDGTVYPLPAEATGFLLAATKIQYDGWRTGGMSVNTLNIGGFGLSVVQDWPRHLQKILSNLQDNARRIFLVDARL